MLLSYLCQYLVAGFAGLGNRMPSEGRFRCHYLPEL